MARAPEHGDRLDFRLPDFTRVSWTSDTARATWEPRLQRIGRAWAEVEWRSVVAGVRRCSLARVPPDDLATRSEEYGRRGLSVMALALEGTSRCGYSSTPTPREPGKPFVVTAAVGRIDDVVEFSQAWRSSDDESIGSLLGYPQCCRAFFRRVWVDKGRVDTTWDMAANTVAPANDANTLEVSGPPPANILWRWSSVRAVPHLPCAFNCSATMEFGTSLLRVGADAGYRAEMDWIEDILSWPVEWTALHGIAEIKTPVLKVVTRTDATASRYVVRRQGTAFPREGAKGLRFPFEVPRRALVSDSAGFQRGLEHPIELTRKPTRPDWYHRDNGFSTRHGMDQAHAPLVDLAHRALEGQSGGVLDLGCGNGALLAKVVAGRDDLVPYGVDRDAAAVAHAGELHPGFPANFTQGDFFAAKTWSAARSLALAFLMVGRLLEVPATDARQLMTSLVETCPVVVLYVYPGYDDRSFGELVRAAGLRVDEQAPGSAGVLLQAERAGSRAGVELRSPSGG